jgi:sugar-specific transcriptional regulator TrmB
MFEKFLEEIGLSDKESKVYLALLSGGESSVVELSKSTKINRTTIYPVIESLLNKGLVSENKVDKKVRFVAESSDRIASYIERQKINLEEQEKRFKEIAPDLKSLEKESSDRPVVRYFEGKEGSLSANVEYMNGLEDTDENMYMIYPRDLVSEVFTGNDLDKFKINRKTNRIKAVSVYTMSKGEYKSDKTSDRVKIDGDKYPIKADISVINEKIKITTLEDRISTLLIYNDDIATTLRSMIKYINDSKKIIRQGKK